MSTRALLAAAVVIVLALSPSISECVEAHQNGQAHPYVLWGWILLVIILALAFGEQFMGSAA